MRIRSIKPEFWRSDDIAALSWNDRLLFIGLWSYVSDNGVGIDKVSSVAADLFAPDLSVDPTETLRRVSLGLDALHAGGLVTRYTVDGKPYLHITTWAAHQVIKNPSQSRHPGPTSTNAIITEPLPRPSVDPTETLPTGTEEPRNRGTEDSASKEAGRQRPPAKPVSDEDDDGPDAVTAQTILGDWIKAHRQRPPKTVIGQVGRHIKALLGEGFAAEHVTAGLTKMRERNLSPSVLPNLVNEFANNVTPLRPTGRVKQALVNGHWQDCQADGVYMGMKTRWVPA